MKSSSPIRPASARTRSELHFLPSYSPELNPDELVNADLERSLPPHPPGQEPSRTRRRNPQVLPPSTTPTSHRARILRRSARPLRPRRVNPVSF
ncbi:transposase [Streptomyces sp. NPDC057027]|uniref:transposase n=1 Tax=Streptomyces sp. NPDC057027 TaxID=3346004 RepID=UPI00362707CD